MGRCADDSAARLKFDFPLLLNECVRHDCGLSHLAAWKYVDTLEVLKQIDGVKVADGCAKLQCLRTACGHGGIGRSHRALDDAILLGEVVRHVAATIGVSADALLRPFASSLDVPAALVSSSLFENVAETTCQNDLTTCMLWPSCALVLTCALPTIFLASNANAHTALRPAAMSRKRGYSAAGFDEIAREAPDNFKDKLREHHGPDATLKCRCYSSCNCTMLLPARVRAGMCVSQVHGC